jgi:hypothetical protein
LQHVENSNRPALGSPHGVSQLILEIFV